MVILVLSGGAFEAWHPPRGVTSTEVRISQGQWRSDTGEFSLESVKAWAARQIPKQGTYRFFKATIGPDAKELDLSSLRIRVDAEYEATYGQQHVKSIETKHPIARVMAIEGRGAVVQYQEGFLSGATEHALVGSVLPSPLTLDVRGRAYRVVDFAVEQSSLGTRLFVFLESATREGVTAEAAADYVRLLRRQHGIEVSRVLIRPDSWSTDQSFPIYFRFALPFGPDYMGNPLPPDSGRFLQSDQVECETDYAREVDCKSLETRRRTSHFRE